jgi:entericidin B
MLKRIVAVCMLALCFATLTGCNTMHGAGKDIEKAGEGIQKSTEKAVSRNNRTLASQVLRRMTGEGPPFPHISPRPGPVADPPHEKRFENV